MVAFAAVASMFLALAPHALAEKSECPSGYVCLWSGPTFGGERAFFPGGETGVHTLANIDPRSGWNHTGNKIVALTGGEFYSVLFEGDSFSGLSSGYTGHISIETGPFG